MKPSAVPWCGGATSLFPKWSGTAALIIGLIIVNVGATRRRNERRPGDHRMPTCCGGLAEQAKEQGIVAFLLDIIPGSVIAAPLPAAISFRSTDVCRAVWLCAASSPGAKASSFLTSSKVSRR